MAEKIKIFELNIDADAAVKETARLADNTEILKRRYDSLKQSTTATTEEVVRAKAAYSDTNKQFKAAERQLTQLVNIQGKEIKTIQQGRVALSVISKEWAKQADLYGANSKEADALSKKKLELTNRLKELEKATGDTRRNVGNYSADLQEAFGKTNLFGRATQGVNTILQVAKPIYTATRTEISSVATSYKAATASTEGFSTAQKAAAFATNLGTAALKIFKVALIATGIGAIVVLLGSLVSWFANTQKGVDLASKAMVFFGAAIDVIIDRLSQVGGALVKFVTGDFAGAFDDLTNAASGFTDELIRETSAAYNLEEALTTLRDREIELITTQAARKQKIEELRLAAKDELTDLRERANLLQQAGDIEKQILEDNIEIAKENARISQEQLDLGESTREQIKENAEAQARVIELETDSLKLRRSIEAEKQGLLKRARAEEATAAKARLAESKKATEAALKESKTRLDIFISENEGRAETLAEQIAFEERIRDERLAILQSEAEAGKKTQSEAELERLKIKQEFLQAQKDLTVEFADEELQIYIESNRSRLEEGQLLTDALVAQEVERLQAIRDKEIEFQAERLAQGEIDQRQYNTLIAEIDQEFADSKTERENELKEQRIAAEVIDEGNRRALQSEAYEYNLGAQLQDLELRKQREIEAAERVGADTALIEEKYAELKKDTAKSVTDAKISLASDAFGNFAEILGKESKAGKAAAIAQTTITTYQSATNAFNSLSVIPIVGTVLGALAAAAAVASGIANVRKIASTPTPTVKAEKGLHVPEGGILKGNRHSQGGIPIEAEGGEYILNRRATQLFYPFIDKMNAIGNGQTGINNSGFFVDGGMVARNFTATAPRNGSVSQNGIDIDMMAYKIAEANRSLPAPVTDVKDVIGQVSNYNQIVNGANI